MTPIELLRLEKAASDCGFERTPEISDADAIELRSAQFPEVVTVRVNSDGSFRVEVSSPLLLDMAEEMSVLVKDYDQLYAVLQRASAVARTIPNRIADRFRRETQRMPQTTEAERLVVQRVGQNLFRDALLDYWQGRCCVTGLGIPSLLRASHIKPWAKCASDDERLDVFNGLLLAPHVDALFDDGWISFEDDGSLIVTDELPEEARRNLGMSPKWRVEKLQAPYGLYLAFHRENELR